MQMRIRGGYEARQTFPLPMIIEFYEHSLYHMSAWEPVYEANVFLFSHFEHSSQFNWCNSSFIDFQFEALNSLLKKWSPNLYFAL